MSIPTPGRIVLYTLSKQDADAQNKRRADAQKHLQDHRENSNGVQIHVGNSLAEGDVYPMVITRVWNPGNPQTAVNGQVLLDGNDLLWVTSTSAGEGPCHFTWPVHSSVPDRIA